MNVFRTLNFFKKDFSLQLEYLKYLGKEDDLIIRQNNYLEFIPLINQELVSVLPLEQKKGLKSKKNTKKWMVTLTEKGREFVDLSFGLDDINDFWNKDGEPFRLFYEKEQQKMTGGSDLRYDLSLSFVDSAFGLETEIQLQKDVICDVCSGKGNRQDTPVEECDTCDGTGKISVRRIMEWGEETTELKCNTCFGKGKTVSDPCNKCNGQGEYTIVEPVYVRVPPGVENGSRLRIRGKGAPGINGGKNGDLYVVIKVEKHPVFDRFETHIYQEKTITPVQVKRGNAIEIPTLEGTAEIRIPQGIKNGTILKLRGRGIIDANTGARGDQYVMVLIRKVKMKKPSASDHDQSSSEALEPEILSDDFSNIRDMELRFYFIKKYNTNVDQAVKRKITKEEKQFLTDELDELLFNDEIDEEEYIKRINEIEDM